MANQACGPYSEAAASDEGSNSSWGLIQINSSASEEHTVTRGASPLVASHMMGLEAAPQTASFF